MKRKWIAIASVMALSLILAGCSSSSLPQPDQPTQGTKTVPKSQLPGKPMYVYISKATGEITQISLGDLPLFSEGHTSTSDDLRLINSRLDGKTIWGWAGPVPGVVTLEGKPYRVQTTLPWRIKIDYSGMAKYYNDYMAAQLKDHLPQGTISLASSVAQDLSKKLVQEIKAHQLPTPKYIATLKYMPMNRPYDKLCPTYEVKADTSDFEKAALALYGKYSALLFETASSSYISVKTDQGCTPLFDSPDTSKVNTGDPWAKANPFDSDTSGGTADLQPHGPNPFGK